MENIFVALKMDGMGWNERTHNLTGSDGAFQKVKKGTALYRTRASPYLYEVMQIEGVNLSKQAHKHVDADDEDEKWLTLERLEIQRRESRARKSRREKRKAKRKRRSPPNLKVRRTTERVRRRKAVKTRTATRRGQRKRRIKSQEKVPRRRHRRSLGFRRRAGVTTSMSQRRLMTKLQLRQTAAQDPPVSTRKPPEMSLRLKQRRRRGKRRQRVLSTKPYSEGEKLVNEVAHLKKNRNKRKQRASDSVPPSPTTSRSAKQPKIAESFNSAAMGEKLKDEVSTGSSRSVSPPLEEPKLPSANEQEVKEVGDGKGKADRDALQIATPVKTSPAPKKFADDEDNEQTSAVKAELTEQERAQQEVWEEAMLTNAGRAAMARLYKQDEAEAKEYLRVEENIERCRAHLEEALEALGKDRGKCMM